MNCDRNLLFGVLALQSKLLEPGRFAEACTLWAKQPTGTLGDLLLHRGWMTPANKAKLDEYLEKKIGPTQPDATHLQSAAPKDALPSDATVDFDRGHIAQPVPLARRITDRGRNSRGQYELTQEHASGGIGRVWLARDRHMGREIALKEILPQHHKNPLVRTRFLREACITGQLEHPGIVPVYELGPVAPDQTPYYTMRFVRGRTLKEAIEAYHEKRAAGRAKPLDLIKLLNIFVSVCQTVAYAHARGVLHRDLKGQNVVLGDFGEAIVLDWGLAKVTGEGAAAEPEDLDAASPVTLGADDPGDQTQQGQVLGTPAYMAPEQAAGKLAEVDQRSDVYGLGAILYEILTGRPPFDGDTALAILRQVLENLPQRPRQLCRDVPLALEAICLKALAKKKEQRYVSARQLARDVQNWLADEPVRAHRERWWTRTGRWARRHRAWVASGAVLLVTAVLGLSVSTFIVGRAQR